MEKPLSRQRRWQLQHIEAGRCMTCGRRRIYRSDRCREHYQSNLERNRKYQRVRYQRLTGGSAA